MKICTGLALLVSIGVLVWITVIVWRLHVLLPYGVNW